MYSYYNKLLPNHFDNYSIPSSIHSNSTRLSTSKTCFYLELALIRESVPLYLFAQMWSSIPDCIYSSSH